MYKILTQYNSDSSIQISTKVYNLHLMIGEEIIELCEFITNKISDKNLHLLKCNIKIEQLKNEIYSLAMNKKKDESLENSLNHFLNKAKSLSIEISRFNFCLGKIQMYVHKISNVVLYKHEKEKKFDFISDPMVRHKIEKEGWNISPLPLSSEMEEEKVYLEDYTKLKLYQHRKLMQNI